MGNEHYKGETREFRPGQKVYLGESPDEVSTVFERVDEGVRRTYVLFVGHDYAVDSSLVSTEAERRLEKRARRKRDS